MCSKEQNSFFFPPSPVAAGQDGSRIRRSISPEVPSSPAFSSVSTADLGSSPILPNLPLPTVNGRTVNLLNTPPSVRSNDTRDTRYFTASWGSPYQASSPYQDAGSAFQGTPSVGGDYLRGVPTRDSSEHSPLQRRLSSGLSIHTPFLRPPPAFERSEGPVSANVLLNRAKRPVRGLTEEWIRQHTENNDLGTERENWLSDNDLGENSSLSSSVSGELEDWATDEVDQKTPTLKSFIQRQVQGRERDRQRGHMRTETITPNNFQPAIREGDANMEHNRGTSVWQGAAGWRDDIAEQRQYEVLPTVHESIPPPPPPKDSPGWRNPVPSPPPKDEKNKKDESVRTRSSTGNPSTPAKPGITTSDPQCTQVPRVKKKLPWKTGKSIMVLLPAEDDRVLKPLTQKDTDRILHDWEQLGYNINGFVIDHPESDTAGVHGQSRGEWPETELIQEERQELKAFGSYKVQIPNKKSWDSYVEELTAAKLRALGVSLGDDDPLVAPPPPKIHRRVTTTYPGLPFSPPLPMSSVSSGHGPPNPFSPMFQAGVIPSPGSASNTGPMPSPAPNQMYGKHGVRQSVSFTGAQSPFGSSFQLPQAHQRSPSLWSPQSMAFQPGHLSRGASPSIGNFASIVSPRSPFGQQDGYFPKPEIPIQMYPQRQSSWQNQLQPQSQMLGHRLSPRLQDLSEEVDESFANQSRSYSKHLQLNEDDHLQKEIDDAEYHLERQFQRQLEHDDYSPHSEKEERKNDQEGVLPVEKNGQDLSRLNRACESEELHHPQPHTRSHSLSQRSFDVEGISSAENSASTQPNSGLSTRELKANRRISSILNNKTLVKGHQKKLSSISNPWVDSDLEGQALQPAATGVPSPKRLGHAVKQSLSTLNVKAAEFRFEPSRAPFTPSTFSFPSGLFESAQPRNNAFAPQLQSQPNTFSRSFGPPPMVGNDISIMSPAFMPGNSDFNFSASGPTFQPGVSMYTRLVDTCSTSIRSVESGTENPAPRSSIFGNIEFNMADIVRQPKKSKALTIVRPDTPGNTLSSDNEFMEGHDGRITQGIGRNKRAKAATNDGDSVPLFAEPTVLQETSREQSSPKDMSQYNGKPEDEENIPAGLDSASPAIHSLATEIPANSGLGESSVEKKPWAAWNLESQRDMADSNAASPFSMKSPSYFNINESKLNDSVSALEDPETDVEDVEPTPQKKHSRRVSSLSACAKPFELGSSWQPVQAISAHTLGHPTTSQPATSESLATTSGIFDATKINRGLLDTDFDGPRFPSIPPLMPEAEETPVVVKTEKNQQPSPTSARGEQRPISHLYDCNEAEDGQIAYEPTFEEIDAVMRHLNDVDSEKVHAQEIPEEPVWHHPSPQRRITVPEVDEESPYRLRPSHLLRSDAPSPSPRSERSLPPTDPTHRNFSRLRDGPFAINSSGAPGLAYHEPIHHLNDNRSLPASEWDDVLHPDDVDKFEARMHFLDGHANELINNIVSNRLSPMENALEMIQQTLAKIAPADPKLRHHVRENWKELQESDADDEDDDDEQAGYRSLSPPKDRRMEKIRTIVMEALMAHNSSLGPVEELARSQVSSDILHTLEEMREQLGRSDRSESQHENIQSMISAEMEKHIPVRPVTGSGNDAKLLALEARIVELTDRNAEHQTVMTLTHQKAAEETAGRHAAEDRLAEAQRQLRASKEDETRLRAIIEEKNHKITDLEDLRSRVTIRSALMESTAEHAQKIQAELENRLSTAENDLREALQKAQYCQVEAEHAKEANKRATEEIYKVKEANERFHMVIEKVKLQMEESMHTRESMRGKLHNLQESTAIAAQDVTEENSRRSRKEAELLARQEVLDARLQAEARTRERLEQEIERLEHGEREGMRAVKESKILKDLLAKAREEVDEAEKSAMKYKREFEEARESGLNEVQRTRNYMQSEIDLANHQVNLVREDLEDQLSRVRSEFESVQLKLDTVNSQTEMLVEGVKEAKHKEVERLKAAHDDIIEDLTARHERQLTGEMEDGHRNEQQLLERLSLSSAKNEHLQDRISHLEESLEISKEAALAAANSARLIRSPVASAPPTPISHLESSDDSIQSPQVPLVLGDGKVIQALRESIQVLQEQLQDRERQIEQSQNAHITKRDDEILWLRELLSVRKSDLQDIVDVIGNANQEFDLVKVRDAAIRLRANLQMEEQERDRALNGGSALSSNTIAASLQLAVASPRVANVVGPVAAAWGSWKTARSTSYSKPGRGIEEVMTNGVSATPSKSSPNFLSGLLTPPSATPASRFSAAQLANRPVRPRMGRPLASSTRTSSMLGMGSQNSTGPSTPHNKGSVSPMGRRPMTSNAPETPIMYRQSSFDKDAEHFRDDGGDFGDEVGFFDDDD